MNRWRQRLAELHGDTELPSAPSANVQNVQNVQNSPPHPASEHFEQIEHGTKPPAATPLSLDRALTTWGDAEEERAAIVEHNGKIPREWAEGFARLHPERPPGDVPPKRWQRFVDDVGLFLDSPFCAVAAALGWRPYDLFGCDRDRPYARIDRAGLVWLLHGDRVVALTQEAAVIETHTRARHTYRCKPAEPSRVLAWELTPRPRGSIVR